jgi:hypothetical protein
MYVLDNLPILSALSVLPHSRAAIEPVRIPQVFNISSMGDKMVFSMAGGRGRMLVNKTDACKQTIFVSRAPMPFNLPFNPNILVCLDFLPKHMR